MSRLIQIAGWSGEPRASVIFVHGLGGNPYDTWRRAANSDTFWPLWLAKDVEGITAYTVAYEAPATNWLGTSMPLQDRAVNILEYFLGEPALKAGPIAFVCHSLGGLIVKQMLLDLQQQANSRPEAADFLSRVRQVVFAATPHTGSRQASLLYDFLPGRRPSPASWSRTTRPCAASTSPIAAWLRTAKTISNIEFSTKHKTRRRAGSSMKRAPILVFREIRPSRLMRITFRL